MPRQTRRTVTERLSPSLAKGVAASERGLSYESLETLGDAGAGLAHRRPL
jgi:hypothetical protein